jgi:HAD superfamily hydrolase (TIGR01459 family)
MIPIFDNLSTLLIEYDTLICDVWGVLHDGIRVYEHANETLLRFRAQGGSVVLLSNSPGRSHGVAGVLAQKGVAPEAWDTLITSGDLTFAQLQRQNVKKIYHIGTSRDHYLFDGLNLQRVALEEAEALVVTGLFDEDNETAQTYLPSLTYSLARGLPLICANPDLIVHVGDALLPCAGAIADLYEKLGGSVYWAGKPHKPAYDQAIAKAASLRGVALDKLNILAIGDALRTDIAGAHGMGLPALLITKGIHRDEVHHAHPQHNTISPEKLNRLAAPYKNTLRGAATALKW